MISRFNYFSPGQRSASRARWIAGLMTAGSLGFSLCGTVRAADTKAVKAPPPLPEFRQFAPLASVQAAAKAAQIALDGIAPPLERATLRPGDSVTALVSLTSGAKLQQWLIALSAVEPTEKEMARRGPAPVFYSSSGYELRFETERAALAIRTI